MLNRRKYFVNPAPTNLRWRQKLHGKKRMMLGIFFRQSPERLNADTLTI